MRIEQDGKYCDCARPGAVIVEYEYEVRNHAMAEPGKRAAEAESPAHF